MGMNFEYTFKGNPSLRTRVNKVMDELDGLYRQGCETKQLMDNLERKGIVNASLYWMRRNDPSGKPDQLELTHPVDSAYYREKGRRREYIGVDPEKIRAAVDGVERYEIYSQAAYKLEQIRERMQRIERQILRLEYDALGEQHSFLGHKIQAHS